MNYKKKKTLGLVLEYFTEDCGDSECKGYI